MVPIWALVQRQGFIRSVGGLTLATFLAQAVGIVSMIIVARLVEQSEIGVFSVFTAYVSMIVPISSLSYQQSIPNAREGGEYHSLLQGILGLSIMTAVLSWWILWVAGYPYPGLLGACIFGESLTQTAGLVNVRNQTFKPMMWARILPSLLLLVMVLLFLSLRDTMGAKELILARLTASGLVGMLYGWYTLHSPLRSSSFRWCSIFGVLVRHRKFVLYVSPSQLFHMMAFNLPTLLIQRFIGSVEAAQYSQTIRFCFAPTTMVSQSISQVYHSKLAYMVRTRSAEAYSQFRLIGRLLLVAGTVLGIVVALVFPPVLVFLLGPNWEMAGQMVRIMAPLYGVMLAISPLEVSFLVSEKQQYALVNHFVSLLISIVAFGAAILTDNLLLGIALFTALSIVRYAFIYLKIRVLTNTQFRMSQYD